MKLTNKDIVIGCLQRIDILQEHARRVQEACVYVRSLNSFSKDVDDGNITQKLYEEENEEWRKLAMWGLTLDDSDRDMTKSAVHQRFMRDGLSVHDWMIDGVAAGYWLSSDELEFRAMAKKAFSPRNEE